MRKLILDVTTKRNWRGPPVGIPRVISEAGRAIYRKRKFQSVVFDPTQRLFREVDFETGVDLGSANFSEPSSLLAMGCGWDLPGLTESILELQKNLDLHYVPLIHDVIPCVYPHFCLPETSDSYTRWFLETTRAMSFALTVSENSRADILNVAAENGITDKDVHVIRLADTFNAEKADSHEPPFVLSVGTIEFRKNHIVLLNAWRILIRKGITPPRLILVGRRGWMDQDVYRQATEDPELVSFVSVISDASDDMLRDLYQRCLFTVYPSRYEGWGLPIAESMAAGKVCLASGTSSMREIAPGLTVELDPLDAVVWAQQVHRFSTNAAERVLLEQKICADYQTTTWDQTADKILSVI